MNRRLGKSLATTLAISLLAPASLLLNSVKSSEAVTALAPRPSDCIGISLNGKPIVGSIAAADVFALSGVLENCSTSTLSLTGVVRVSLKGVTLATKSQSFTLAPGAKGTVALPLPIVGNPPPLPNPLPQGIYKVNINVLKGTKVIGTYTGTLSVVP